MIHAKLIIYPWYLQWNCVDLEIHMQWYICKTHNIHMIPAMKLRWPWNSRKWNLIINMIDDHLAITQHWHWRFVTRTARHVARRWVPGITVTGWVTIWCGKVRQQYIVGNMCVFANCAKTNMSTCGERFYKLLMLERAAGTDFIISYLLTPKKTCLCCCKPI